MDLAPNQDHLCLSGECTPCPERSCILVGDELEQGCSAEIAQTRKPTDRSTSHRDYLELDAEPEVWECARYATRRCQCDQPETTDHETPQCPGCSPKLDLRWRKSTWRGAARSNEMFGDIAPEALGTGCSVKRPSVMATVNAQLWSGLVDCW